MLWGRQRVWLVERRADLYDPAGLVAKELASHFRLLRKVDAMGANISLYETNPANEAH
jgi:mannosyltransferase